MNHRYGYDLDAPLRSGVTPVRPTTHTTSTAELLGDILAERALESMRDELQARRLWARIEAAERHAHLTGAPATTHARIGGRCLLVSIPAPRTTILDGPALLADPVHH